MRMLRSSPTLTMLQVLLQHAPPTASKPLCIRTTTPAAAGCACISHLASVWEISFRKRQRLALAPTKTPTSLAASSRAARVSRKRSATGPPTRTNGSSKAIGITCASTTRTPRLRPLHPPLRPQRQQQQQHLAGQHAASNRASQLHPQRSNERGVPFERCCRTIPNSCREEKWAGGTLSKASSGGVRLRHQLKAGQHPSEESNCFAVGAPQGRHPFLRTGFERG
mmetsp:Transcript_32897/g.70802  ORF Transcript_32897/g.70802 Transcript_32897/m.70802 type:complete len:224 (+) Transcript_32897:573-1244(+)